MAENKMALGARFQKLRRALNSQAGREELNFQTGLNSQGLPCFSANIIFL